MGQGEFKKEKLGCCRKKKKKKKIGDAGYRSPYLSHAKRALYHLSYIPVEYGSKYFSLYNQIFSCALNLFLLFILLWDFANVCFYNSLLGFCIFQTLLVVLCSTTHSLQVSKLWLSPLPSFLSPGVKSFRSLLCFSVYLLLFFASPALSTLCFIFLKSESVMSCVFAYEFQRMWIFCLIPGRFCHSFFVLFSSVLYWLF